MKERAVIIAGYDTTKRAARPRPPARAERQSALNVTVTVRIPIPSVIGATRSQGGDLPINHLKTSIALPKGFGGRGHAKHAKQSNSSKLEKAL